MVGPISLTTLVHKETFSSAFLPLMDTSLSGVNELDYIEAMCTVLNRACTHQFSLGDVWMGHQMPTYLNISTRYFLFLKDNFLRNIRQYRFEQTNLFCSLEAIFYKPMGVIKADTHRSRQNWLGDSIKRANFIRGKGQNLH